jgi:hypothetical protein
VLWPLGRRLLDHPLSRIMTVVVVGLSTVLWPFAAHDNLSLDTVAIFAAHHMMIII